MAPGMRYAACVVILALAMGPGSGGGMGSRGVEAASASKSDEERRAEYERFVEKMMDIMPAEDLANELFGVIHRNMDSERRERRKKELDRDFDTNDEALLERVGRLVVQWVNTRLTPRSDDECDWSWGRWRCDPQCKCFYKYRFGDYTPGRSCRLRPEGERGLATCDPEAGNDISLLEKLASFVGKIGKKTWRFTSEHVIPQTDKDCRFSVAHSLEERRLVCSPQELCAFRYKFGDMHPGRSCRIRRPGDDFSMGMTTETRNGGGKRTDSGSSSGGRGWGASAAEEAGGAGTGGGWSFFDSAEGDGGRGKGYGDREQEEDEEDIGGGLFEYDEHDYLL